MWELVDFRAARGGSTLEALKTLARGYVEYSSTSNRI